MTLLEEALTWILKEEGGYVWDRDDAGGETNYGISKRAHPEVDIKNLTPEKAKTIYVSDYWNVIKGYALPRPWALTVFDAAVRMGPFRAICLLQGTLGEEVDGIIGPLTRDACLKYMPRLDNYLARCMTFYVQHTNPKFHTGQLLRVLRLRDQIKNAYA